jgi:hypothetical protein
MAALNDEAPLVRASEAPKQLNQDAEIVPTTTDSGNVPAARTAKFLTLIDEQGRYPPKTVPIMDVVATRKGSLTAICPICGARHWHGDPNGWRKPIGVLLGHRGSHCANSYDENGSPRLPYDEYVLRMAGVYELPKEIDPDYVDCDFYEPPNLGVWRTLLWCKHCRSRHLQSPRWALRIVRLEEARQIVRSVAARDDRFRLVRVVGEPTETWSIAGYDSEKMTIHVAINGAFIDSLIEALAKLILTENGYEKHRHAIKRFVLAAVKELPR